MHLLNRFRLHRLWRREFARVRAELGSYTRRELSADLRLSPGDIPDIAAEAADRRVAAYVRSHPGYRGAFGGRDAAGTAGAAFAG